MSERTAREVLSINWKDQEDRAAALTELLVRAEDDAARDAIFLEIVRNVGNVEPTESPYDVTAIDPDTLQQFDDRRLDRDVEGLILTWRNENNEPTVLAAKMREAYLAQEEGDARMAWLVFLLEDLADEPIVHVSQGVLDALDADVTIDLTVEDVAREIRPLLMELAERSADKDNPARAFWNAVDRMLVDESEERRRIVIMAVAIGVVNDPKTPDLSELQLDTEDDGGEDDDETEEESDDGSGDEDEEPAERASAS